MIALEEQKKRNIAYKLRIGDIIKAKPVMTDGKLLNLEIGDKKIVRVNLIANVIEKYNSEGEKRYSSITLDDASGQIRVKAFGDDIHLVNEFSQGDTLQIIGTVREYNSEIYVAPEITKKVDARWLLVRKLELQKIRESLPVASSGVRDILLGKIKDAEKDNGIDIDNLIMNTEASPETINSEITKLLEDGLIYEPRPGRLRYLG